MRRLVRGVGSGIGLASEAIQHHKDKKEASPSPAAREKDPLERNRGKEADLAPPSYHEANQGEGVESSESDIDNDEEEWQLDEASEAIKDKKDPTQVARREVNVDELVDDFTARHPPPMYSPSVGRLQAPVVLPQRRPHAKERGFVRAYAPMLADCGIDQATFLEFLDDFDQSTKAAGYISVINGAAQIVGLVPDPICMAVSISVQVAAGTAKAIQSRHRTNVFLDQMNDRLFRPRGLYCLLMTFKPGRESEEPVLLSNIISTSITPADSKFKQQLKTLKLTSGTTKGEFQLPEAAPLVFPRLDALPEDSEKENALKRSSKFVADYQDRRAQAQFSYQNPDSKLAVPEKPQFTSRYSDPNHPANSGSIISLVTGGHVNPFARTDARRRARRDRKQQRRGGPPMTEAEKRQPKKGIIRRLLKMDVIYMMIVNMPTQAEMDEARRAAGVQDAPIDQTVEVDMK